MTDSTGQRPFLLPQVPDKVWEVAGLLSGLSAAFYIVLQILSELGAKGPSTLSFAFVAGNLLNIVFWLLYGIRFRRWAIWAVNVVCLLAQAALLAVILLRR
jgi:uncharacterized protein with PQ loop repeat